jgi:L-lysine exporter family protein LysE/ArgO
MNIFQSFPKIASKQRAFMGTIFFEGFFLQASLILALGAQNIFVMESGLRRQNHYAVSFTCFLCDLALILIGVAGAATLFTSVPLTKILIGFAGVYFLFSTGIEKIVRCNDSGPAELSSEASITLKQSLVMALTFSLLNPHAYLDAFILIGGFSSKYSLMEERILLGLGAAIYSGVWFLVLSSLSSTLKPFLLNPKRMRVISGSTGLILIVLAGKLAIDVYSWLPFNTISSTLIR